MQAIVRRSAVISLWSLIPLLGGCSENPTGTSVTPPAVRLDRGVTFGSGGRSMTASGEGNTTAADSGSTATTRGGVTFGSGG